MKNSTTARISRLFCLGLAFSLLIQPCLAAEAEPRAELPKSFQSQAYQSSLPARKTPNQEAFQSNEDLVRGVLVGVGVLAVVIAAIVVIDELQSPWDSGPIF